MMAKSAVEVLKMYADAYRTLISEKNFSFTEKTVKELLRIMRDEDWSFIVSSMDIIGDACEAITHFLRFGLEGSTKYNEIGEKYLRLYGILNAIYLQQEAIMRLYKIMNVPGLAEMRKKILSLRIIDVRHKLGAHSTGYRNKKIDKIESYVPVRISLYEFTCQFINYEDSVTDTVDLKKCIDEYLNMMIGISDKMYEKTMKTFYQTDLKKLAEINEKLSEMRIVRDGGMVIETLGSGKIIINTMSTKPEK